MEPHIVSTFKPGIVWKAKADFIPFPDNLFSAEASHNFNHVLGRRSRRDGFGGLRFGVLSDGNDFFRCIDINKIKGNIGILHPEAFLFFLFADEQHRSEEHTSELQSLMRISYAVFCLKKKTNNN